MIFNVVLVLFLATGQAKIHVTQEQFGSREVCRAQTTEFVNSIKSSMPNVVNFVYDCTPFVQFKM